MKRSEQEDNFLMPCDFSITVEILKFKFRAQGWQRALPVMAKINCEKQREDIASCYVE